VLSCQCFLATAHIRAPCSRRTRIAKRRRLPVRCYAAWKRHEVRHLLLHVKQVQQPQVVLLPSLVIAQNFESSRNLLSARKRLRDEDSCADRANVGGWDEQRSQAATFRDGLPPHLEFPLRLIAATMTVRVPFLRRRTGIERVNEGERLAQAQHHILLSELQRPQTQHWARPLTYPSKLKITPSYVVFRRLDITSENAVQVHVRSLAALAHLCRGREPAKPAFL